MEVLGWLVLLVLTLVFTFYTTVILVLNLTFSGRFVVETFVPLIPMITFGYLTYVNFPFVLAN
jgi:hypothetical protein